MLFGVFLALYEALVPLLFGATCAGAAAVLYVAFLRDADLVNFYSAASQVGVGLLVVLIVEGVVARGDDPSTRPLRAGTVAMAAFGTLCALAGVLVTATFPRGILFALTWGGVGTGMIGLFVFVAGPAADASSSGKRHASAAGYAVPDQSSDDD